MPTQNQTKILHDRKLLVRCPYSDSGNTHTPVILLRRLIQTRPTKGINSSRCIILLPVYITEFLKIKVSVLSLTLVADSIFKLFIVIL